MILIKHIASLSISFIISSLLGELIEKILTIILPHSLAQVAWISNGMLAAYSFILLSLLGSLFVYGTEKHDLYIRNYNRNSYVAAAIIITTSSINITASILFTNDKKLTVYLSEISLVTILFVYTFIKNKNSNSKEPINVKNIDTIKQSLLVRSIVDTQHKLSKSTQYQQRQELELKLAWLDTYIYIAENVDKTPDEKAEYIYSIDEEDIKLPLLLNEEIFLHYRLSQIVAWKYSDFLNKPNDYSSCIYKPEAILPFPKSDIIRICKHYSRCLAKDLFVSRALLMADKERAKQVAFAVLEVETILNNDTSYIPVEESMLPSNPDENAVFGKIFSMNN